jgi:hypothetical protein
MSVCRTDDSPWCAPGTCPDCDKARGWPLNKPEILGFSEDELRAELKRRNDEKEIAAGLAKKVRVDRVQRMIAVPAAHDLILLLSPDHSRNTCVEGKSINEGRCWRCDIQAMLDCQDAEEIEKRVRITL